MLPWKISTFSCWKKQIVLNGTTMLGNSETYKQNYHRFDKDNLCEDWKQCCGTVDSEALYSLTLTQQNIVTRWSTWFWCWDWLILKTTSVTVPVILNVFRIIFCHNRPRWNYCYSVTGANNIVCCEWSLQVAKIVCLYICTGSLRTFIFTVCGI